MSEHVGIDWEWLAQQEAARRDRVRPARPIGRSPSSFVWMGGVAEGSSRARTGPGNDRGDEGMTSEKDSSEEALQALQERAKELECLYRVDEILGRYDGAGRRVVHGDRRAIPPGWQYPESCRAALTIFGTEYGREGIRDSGWVQSAPVQVRKEVFGEVSVYYTEEKPEADEGPFLAQERKTPQHHRGSGWVTPDGVVGPGEGGVG